MKKYTRKAIPLATKRNVIIRDTWGGRWVMKCDYCGKECGDRYQFDHRVPVCRGGSNDMDNLALSCPPCNSRKGALTDEEFSDLGEY